MFQVMELDRIRYKIALGIGHHLELAPMLNHALAIILAELQCKSSIVCRPRFAPSGNWHMFVAHSHPKAGNSLISAIGASWLPRGPDTVSLNNFWKSPPAAASTQDRFRAFIFPLPEFGALILDAAPSKIKIDILSELAPVIRQLATACIHCARFQTASRQADKVEKTEGARQNDKTYLDQLFDNAQVGIIMAENNGTILRINPEFQRIFGYSFKACVGKNIDTILALGKDRQSAARITQSVSHGKKRAFEARRRCKDGTVKNVSVMASPIVLNGEQVAVYAFYQDVTARRQIEAELLKAKKLEATGNLAGGIAHDFNNLLAIIMGNIDLALLDIPENSDCERSLTHAKQICRRTHDLTQKFITFSAGGQPVKTMVQLADLLREVAEDLITDHAVACRFDLPVDLRPVLIDANQFRHVVSAVLINAAEAMPSGGDITIFGTNLTAAQIQRNPLLEHQRGYIRIAVGDTGMGIPTKEIPQLFDPYYSTKKSAGQTGLGMGLTVAHSIVIQHEGIIQIHSKENTGTTVNLYLPHSGPPLTHLDDQP